MRSNADDIHRGTARAGFVFAGLFLVAFLLIGADTPDYAAPDREWVTWAEDTGSANEIAMVAILLAGIAFLILGAAIRARFAADDAHSKILEHGYVTGGILGIAGIVMAILLIGAASFEGAGTDAAVLRAVNLAATGPFLLASMGFVAFLAGVGLQTRRTGVYAVWTAHVAMAGAVLLALTFLTVLGGEDSAFGVGFPLGFLCLLIWSTAVALTEVRPSSG